MYIIISRQLHKSKALSTMLYNIFNLFYKLLKYKTLIKPSSYIYEYMVVTSKAQTRRPITKALS